MAKKQIKSPRGENEAAQKGVTVKNVTTLPSAEYPVDPFERVEVPESNFRGEDADPTDFSGESGSGKG